MLVGGRINYGLPLLFKGGFLKKIFRRILWIYRENKRTTKRYLKIQHLLSTETDDKKRLELEFELESCGVMRIMVCRQCSSYRSDLEYKEKGKEGANCKRCGSNKISYPQKIPKLQIIRLLIRYIISGY